MVRRMTDRERRGWSVVPAGLVIGLGLLVASTWVAQIGHMVTRSSSTHWWLLEVAGAIGGACLAAFGCRELSRRVPAQRARGALVAAAGFAGLAIVRAGGLIVAYLYVEDIDSWFDKAQYVQTAVVVVATVGLVLTAARRPVWMWIAGALAAVAAAPPTPLQEYVVTLAPKQFELISTVMITLWVVVALILTLRASDDVAAPPSDNAPAIAGLRRTALGLWIWLGGATLVITVISIPVKSVQTGVTLLGTVIGAVAMMVFATGVVRIASASGTALPRYRLQVVAFLAVWNAILQTASALYAYRLTFGTVDPLFELHSSSPAMPWTMRIVTVITLAILITAVGRLASTAGDDKLKRNASQTLLLLILLMAGHFGLTALGAGARPGDLAFYAISFGSTLMVGSFVLAASLCTKAAQALELRPALAPATLRVPSDPA